MTDDAFDERYETHDQMLRRMLAILVRQGEILEEQRGINDRLTGAIERLEVTQACIETLLSRIIPPSSNGQEA